MPGGGAVVSATTRRGRYLRMTLLRYDGQGRRARRFGRRGIAVSGPARRRFFTRSVVRQADGRFVLLGTSGLDIALAGLLPSGRIDRRFGRDGFTRRRIGRHDGTAPAAGAIQGRRRLIVAGTDSLDERIDYSSYIVTARFKL